MSLNTDNTAVLAAAGSCKTECIVDAALSVAHGRVLITTYTDENQREIVRRFESKVGVIPKHVTIMGWFTFLITHCVKPYQRAVTGEPFWVRGLTFEGKRSRFAKKDDLSFFLDRGGNLYRDGVSDCAVQLNKKTGGAVVGRLERIFTHVFIDEVQDCVGYDLDVLDLLLSSRIRLMMVGDPRQFTYATNQCSRNKKYRGAGLSAWLSERQSQCTIEKRSYSYRCNQVICDFADRIFPEMPPTRAVNVPVSGHDGVFLVFERLVHEYLRVCGSVTALRYNKKSSTLGLVATNIGLSKGSTHNRVLIFPTQPMLLYLADGDPSKLTSREKLYVAVTRARFSVAFVVPNNWSDDGRSGATLIRSAENFSV